MILITLLRKKLMFIDCLGTRALSVPHGSRVLLKLYLLCDNGTSEFG
jgi:hypothetical protein